MNNPLKIENEFTVIGLATRATEIADQLESMKPLYEELDKVTLQLKELTGVGAAKATFVGEKAVTVVDNFASANVAFKTAAVRRYELKVEDTDKFLKRLKKESVG